MAGIFSLPFILKKEFFITAEHNSHDFCLNLQINSHCAHPQCIVSITPLLINIALKIIGSYEHAPVTDFPATFWLTESCVLRPGRPFFIPDWDEDFRLYPMIALRIDRVGKGMPARFASRYITGLSLWLHARGCCSLRKLQAAGKPLGSALAFDNSLISAPFIDTHLSDLTTVEATIKTADKQVIISVMPMPAAARMLEAIGSRNTVRTGDILLLPASDDTISPSRGLQVDIDLTQPRPIHINHLNIK